MNCSNAVILGKTLWAFSMISSVMPSLIVCASFFFCSFADWIVIDDMMTVRIVKLTNTISRNAEIYRVKMLFFKTVTVLCYSGRAEALPRIYNFKAPRICIRRPIRFSVSTCRKRLRASRADVSHERQRFWNRRDNQSPRPCREADRA